MFNPSPRITVLSGVNSRDHAVRAMVVLGTGMAPAHHQQTVLVGTHLVWTDASMGNFCNVAHVPQQSALRGSTQLHTPWCCQQNPSHGNHEKSPGILLLPRAPQSKQMHNPWPPL